MGGGAPVLTEAFYKCLWNPMSDFNPLPTNRRCDSGLLGKGILGTTNDCDARVIKPLELS